MGNIKKYSWVVVLIGVVIIIIAFFTPTNIPHGDTNYVWMSGLTGRDETHWLGSRLALGTCIACSILISIGIVVSILFVMINFKRPETKSGLVWVLMGVFTIIIVVIWSILIHFLLPIIIREYSSATSGIFTVTWESGREYIWFWEYNSPGFGVIGPIIGSIVMIVGGILKGLSD